MLVGNGAEGSAGSSRGVTAAKEPMHRATPEAYNGEVVVASIDAEVTLKR